MNRPTAAAEATTDDHLRNMISLMKRGAHVTLSGIPDDPTFLTSHFASSYAKAMAEKMEAALSAALAVEAGAELPVELEGVADAIAYGKGFWRSCSGCHETNEGVPLGTFSNVLKCHIGMGCFECGGIGAIWDTTDYEDMGRFPAEEDAALTPASSAVEGEAVAITRRTVERPPLIIEDEPAPTPAGNADLTRPIIGIENRAAQEVFDIMVDRIRFAGEWRQVGEAGTMPGTTGFTMAAFKADDVPLGTRLFAAASPAPQTEGE